MSDKEKHDWIVEKKITLENIIKSIENVVDDRFGFLFRLRLQYKYDYENLAN